MPELLDVLRAMNSDKRLQILTWLEHPTRHFPAQVDGDLETDGVCSVLIARRLKVSEPTTSRHMKILVRAGLVRAKSIKQWTFYRRDERGIAQARRQIDGVLRTQRRP